MPGTRLLFVVRAFQLQAVLLPDHAAHQAPAVDQGKRLSLVEDGLEGLLAAAGDSRGVKAEDLPDRGYLVYVQQSGDAGLVATILA